MQCLRVMFLFFKIADAFFKAAISLVPEVPKMINIDGKMRPSEAFLLEFLCNFFSTLLIIPVSIFTLLLPPSLASHIFPLPATRLSEQL